MEPLEWMGMCTPPAWLPVPACAGRQLPGGWHLQGPGGLAYFKQSEDNFSSMGGSQAGPVIRRGCGREEGASRQAESLVRQGCGGSHTRQSPRSGGSGGMSRQTGPWSKEAVGGSHWAGPLVGGSGGRGYARQDLWSGGVGWGGDMPGRSPASLPHLSISPGCDCWGGLWGAGPGWLP